MPNPHELSPFAPNRYRRVIIAIAALTVGLLVAGLALTSLGGRPKPPTKWQRLSDNSFLSEPLVADDFTSITRCWKVGGEYDCINLFSYKDDFTPKRFQTQTLVRDPETDATGYYCTMWDRTYTEGLRKNVPGDAATETIKSNTVAVVDFEIESAEYWTRSFVDTYARNNQIEPSTYFDCHLILKLVKSGSYLSIGSSDLSFDSMVGVSNSRKPKISSGSDKALLEL